MRARRWLWILGLLLWVGWAQAETTVPIDLQVELLRKLVRFERGFVARCGSEVTVVIVMRSSNQASMRAVSQLESAFERAHDIAGKPFKVVTHAFTTAAALKTTVVKERAQLVFVTPGFESELSGIALVFAAQPTITVTTDGDQVAQGIVIGFELVSSKPKISLNLGQARRQGLDFNSDLFRLAKVIQ